jgi:DNA modification methylase
MDDIEWNDALVWLKQHADGAAQVVIFDPPYAVGTPVRGREDGAAGSVFAPFSFLHRAMLETARVLRPGGVAVVFADWRRTADIGYMATISGLRPSSMVAWTRKRPGTGGLFRSAWDPILIVSRGVPTTVDRSAVRNVVETDDVVEADYPTRRTHPYGKPVKVFEHILPRCARAGDLVLDPFAGSGVSRSVALALGMRWAGCDIDRAFAASANPAVAL